MKAEQHSDLDDDGAAHRRLGTPGLVAIALLLGVVLAVVALWVWRGNPFSAANEVAYREVVVGSVTEDEDQICWAQDPERRDSPQTCAILALDPAVEVPEAGEMVTIGVVELRAPDGTETTQVVHAAPAEGGAATGGADPTPTPGQS